MEIFFTSDTHFGHPMLVDKGHRPFSTVHEMNAEITKRWNEVVKPDDEVWHLGDVMWKENVGYLDKLQGKLHLVVGNHDHTRTRKHPRWLSVSPFEELKDEHFTLIVLCHYALETWNRSHYGTVHLHGHSHGSLPSRGRRLDVGVDAWDFRPVSLETLRVHPTLAANPHLCDHHRPV